MTGKPAIDDVVNGLSDDALLRTMLAKVAETLPRFEDAPARLRTANAQAPLLIAGAADHAAALEAAVLAEREACAKLADRWRRDDPAHPIGPTDHAVFGEDRAARNIGADIRARSAK